jgi:hypothetical protein
MLQPLIKALSATAIISGIIFVLWGIGSLVVADNSHNMTSHVACFVVLKLVLGGGLISAGACFFDFSPVFRNSNRDKPKDIARFYRPGGK